MANLLPGDLVFVRGQSWFSRAIRWAERTPGEPESFASHVAGMVSGHMVVEAVSSVVHRPIEECVGDRDYQVWRCAPLTDAHRAALAVEAMRFVGRGYGYPKIAAHLADSFLSRLRGRDVYAARRLAKMDSYPICSWVWAYAYDRALGYTFGVEPNAAQPDDMLDHCATSPEWELVAFSFRGEAQNA